MHLADAFIQKLYIFLVCMCVPWELNPTTLCAANAMLYHWATGTTPYPKGYRPHFDSSAPHIYTPTISSVKQSKTNVSYREETKQPRHPIAGPSTPWVLSSAGKLIRYLHGPNPCFIVTPCLHRMRAARQNTIELIIVRDAVYTGCGAARQIPDIKLLTHFKWFSTVVSSIDRLTTAVASGVDTSLPLFHRRFPHLCFIRHLYLSVARLGLANVVMCTIIRSLLASWVDTPLTADWLQVCFGTRPDSKAFLNKYIPHL